MAGEMNPAGSSARVTEISIQPTDFTHFPGQFPTSTISKGIHQCLILRAPARSAIHQLSKQSANGSENIAWCNSLYQQQSHAICCYLSKLQGSELLAPRYNLTYINIMLHYMIIIIIIMIMIIIISWLLSSLLSLLLSLSCFVSSLLCNMICIYIYIIIIISVLQYPMIILQYHFHIILVS